MWMTLAFVAALGSVPAQPGQLALTHARLTYGALGAPRPTNKFLPGDSFVLAFDIEGIKADANGKVLYSMGMEVTDQSGKVHFKQVPRDRHYDGDAGFVVGAQERGATGGYNVVACLGGEVRRLRRRQHDGRVIREGDLAAGILAMDDGLDVGAAELRRCIDVR